MYNVQAALNVNAQGERLAFFQRGAFGLPGDSHMIRHAQFGGIGENGFRFIHHDALIGSGIGGLQVGEREGI